MGPPFGPPDVPELAPPAVAGEELVPPLRGFDDEPLGRVLDAAGAAPAVAVAAPELRVAAGAVLGRESGVCCPNVSEIKNNNHVEEIRNILPR